MDKIRVLLVDDEREFVTTLSERIEMRNVDSRIAFCGEEALDLLARHSFDVMVLDLNMPGMDGLETLDRVKHMEPDIQVIILTGHGSEKERIKAKALGAFAYMQKPVDIDTLMERMEAARASAKKGGS